MAIADLDEALAQRAANVPWHGDLSKARLAFEAIDWIIINRPQIIATNNRTINFSKLDEQWQELSNYLAIKDTNVNRCSFTRGGMLT